MINPNSFRLACFCANLLFFAIWPCLHGQTARFIQRCKDLQQQCQPLSEQAILQTKGFRQLQQGGNRALEQLLALILHQKQPTVLRIFALDLLRHLGNSASTQALLPLLLDSSAPVPLRQKILQTAAILKNATVLDYAVMMIEKKMGAGFDLGDAFVILALPASATVYRRLFALFHSPEITVREKAASVFSFLQHREASKHLQELLGDSSPQVRKTAVWALANQRNFENYRIVYRMLKDPSPLVRERSLAALLRYQQLYKLLQEILGRNQRLTPQLKNYRLQVDFSNLVQIYQSEIATATKFFRQYQQLCARELVLLGRYRRQPDQRPAIARRLKHLRQQWLPLFRRLDQQRVLLSSCLAAIAAFTDKPEKALELVWPLLEHSDLQLAHLGFQSTSKLARECAYRFRFKAKVVRAMIRYFSRLHREKWRWIDVGRSLGELTRIDLPARPDAWQNWLNGKQRDR